MWNKLLAKQHFHLLLAVSLPLPLHSLSVCGLAVCSLAVRRTESLYFARRVALPPRQLRWRQTPVCVAGIACGLSEGVSFRKSLCPVVPKGYRKHKGDSVRRMYVIAIARFSRVEGRSRSGIPWGLADDAKLEYMKTGILYKAIANIQGKINSADLAKMPRECKINYKLLFSPLSISKNWL